MARHDTKTRLGIENLEARDGPSGLDPVGFSWGEFSWGEWSWGESRMAQTNPSNGGATSIPVEQLSVALTPTRG